MTIVCFRGKSKLDDGLATNSTDMAPDLSLVKIEPASDPGLDMYVDVPVEGAMGDHQRERDQEEESDLELEEASGDWSRDEMSNEATGNDQNNSWYIGQFKGRLSWLSTLDYPRYTCQFIFIWGVTLSIFFLS